MPAGKPGVVVAQPVGGHTDFLKEVRGRSKGVTLGEAKAYVATLPVDQASPVSGCYKVSAPSRPLPPPKHHAARLA